MNRTAAVALLGLSFAFAAPNALSQDPTIPEVIDPRATQRAAEQAYAAARRVELLGFDTYRPEHASVTELMQAAETLTNRMVDVGVADRRGGLDLDRRERMFRFGEAIGIQDFEAGRKELLGLLQQIDTRFGELNTARPEDQEDFVDVFQLRSLDISSAYGLIQSIIGDVQIEAVPESRSLVLRGVPQRVADARTLLQKTDLPAPQFTLTCMAIAPTDGEADATLPAELVGGLTELTGVTKFERLGSLLARGSVGARSQLEISGQFPNLGVLDGQVSSIQLEASPDAYDAATQTLSLRRCALMLQRPLATAEPAPSEAAATGLLSGITSSWSRETLQTDLSLVASEYTVVGALGSDQVFLVLRFTAH